ncbi:MAG: bifunctional anthranilate synthase component I family protein/class IV aminotransferase [Verrucomicrobiota bacterium]|jgi:para-aminobenzoate synthetase/4-amino-4-deoxychorismate lyase
MAAPAANAAVIHDATRRCWLHLSDPVEILVADCLADVVPLLARVEQRTRANGLHAAGFLSYEAAPAFDPAFATRIGDDFPLAWFGLYARAEPVALPPDDGLAPAALSWEATISEARYRAAIRQIKHYIRLGHTYQVNFSFRLIAPFLDDPWPFFLRMVPAQAGLHGAFIRTERWTICCASPELFFSRVGGQLTCRPMKGTAARGLSHEQDRRQQDWLQTSAKNRAENVMIVDMVRNDLGRIATPGTVVTRELFALEQYPTVWQMTSTVIAEATATLPGVFAALFPAASITGAPKPHTTQIIAELEDTPRRIYTGTIGFVRPNGDAQFNVAIRTALVDAARGRIEYGVGGGIVWDSQPAEEYAECQAKAAILIQRQPAFSLLESLLWTPGDGFFLLELHLERLIASAGYFSFPADPDGIRRRLQAFAQTLAPQPHKVRALLAADGTFACEAAPIEPPHADAPLRVCLATAPVATNDVFLYHKTTHRSVYAQARQQQPDADDVLLWNERGELTEASSSNLVVEINDERFTPPVSCGLLAGTFRETLLREGRIRERIIRPDELRTATRVFLINSVRRWRQVRLLDHAAPPASLPPPSPLRKDQASSTI